jgi:hypothetical protein
MIYIKRTYGPKRIKYENDIIADKIILKSKIKTLDNTLYKHLTLLDEIENKDKLQQLITNKP